MNQPTKTSASGPSRQPTPMEAFQFTAEDLAANRNGEITEKQHGQLKATQRQMQKLLIRALGVMFATGAMYVAFWPDAAHVREVIAQNPIVLVLFIGVALVLWGSMIAVSWIGMRRTTRSELNSIAGSVKLVGKPVEAVGGKLYQQIQIGKRSFSVTRDQALSFIPGETYIAYFVGKSQMAQIISVEPST